MSNELELNIGSVKNTAAIVSSMEDILESDWVGSASEELSNALDTWKESRNRLYANKESSLEDLNMDDYMLQHLSSPKFIEISETLSDEQVQKYLEGLSDNQLKELFSQLNENTVSTQIKDKIIGNLGSDKLLALLDSMSDEDIETLLNTITANKLNEIIKNFSNEEIAKFISNMNNEQMNQLVGNFSVEEMLLIMENMDDLQLYNFFKSLNENNQELLLLKSVIYADRFGNEYALEQEHKMSEIEIIARILFHEDKASKEGAIAIAWTLFNRFFSKNMDGKKDGFNAIIREAYVPYIRNDSGFNSFYFPNEYVESNPSIYSKDYMGGTTPLHITQDVWIDYIDLALALVEAGEDYEKFNEQYPNPFPSDDYYFYIASDYVDENHSDDSQIEIGGNTFSEKPH